MSVLPASARHRERSAAAAVERDSVWVAAMVVSASLVWWLLGRGVTPWIFPDELVYGELARSLAEDGVPAIRGETSFGYGLGYPLLLAPAWLLSSDGASAYELAKVVNALVLGSTAIPVFLLARTFVSSRSALVVAGLSVLAPSMAYAGALMTEVALYPVVAWAALLMVRALTNPTPSRQVLVFVAIGCAVLVKPLGLVLVPAFVSAILLQALLERRSSTSAWALGRYGTTWACLLVGGVALVGVSLYADGPRSVLGVYGTAVDHVDLSTVPLRFLAHLGVLEVYVLAVPMLAATVSVARGLGRNAAPLHRAYAALALSLVVWLVGAVAAFSSEPVAGAEGFVASVPLRERNVFVLLPLVLVGAALFFARPLADARLKLSIVAGGLLAIPFIPWSDLPRAVNPQNLSVAPFVIAADGGWLRMSLAVVVLGCAGALWAFAGGFRGRTCWLVLACWFVLLGPLAAATFKRGADLTKDDAFFSSRTWIDDAVPREAEVVVVWAERGRTDAYARPRPEHAAVFAAEFFNRAVGRVYALGSHLPYALPDQPISREGRRLLLRDGSPLVADYVLSQCPALVRGTVLGRAPHGVRLIRVSRPLRLDSRGC